MPTPPLVVTDLHKHYTLNGHQIQVLSGASFTTTSGESIAIIGKSGSGKSTLMHLLGGLDKPDAGNVFVNGKDLYKLSSRQRTHLRASEIGFVFQAYHLLPEMTITENVILPAMALGKLSRKEMLSRAEQLLEHVGLSDRLNHKPQELSGGEQQRAAIARALMNEPPLILADEPTGNLDAETGDRVMDLLFDLTQKQSKVLVMVTHNPETAARCSRTLTLQDGLLV
ncbi:MAG: ABC transporter ATP-binding protein [Kiritimatiellae bacterium]|nr:ABC transporter ATP-binding protein [Kiritimatiellia bacterium]